MLTQRVPRVARSPNSWRCSITVARQLRERWSGWCSHIRRCVRRTTSRLFTTRRSRLAMSERNSARWTQSMSPARPSRASSAIASSHAVSSSS
jgi:hypothetical protein